MVYQTASSPCPAEVSLRLCEGERGVMSPAPQPRSAPKTSPRCPKKSCLHLVMSEVFLVYTALLFLITLQHFFFPLFLLWLDVRQGDTLSLPRDQLYISNTTLPPSLANKPRSGVYQSELSTLWYSLHSWSPFSFSESKPYSS